MLFRSSGNSLPIESDKMITQKINEACTLMAFQLPDHLIILPVEGYYSFADDYQIYSKILEINIIKAVSLITEELCICLYICRVYLDTIQISY